MSTERMAAPRRGEDGFRARCSGQRGGLTGARVTGPHIGELSVPTYMPASRETRRDARATREKGTK